jgi:hypothetical protein
MAITLCGLEELFADMPGWRVSRFGPSGMFACKGVRKIIVTDAEFDGQEWRHASISRSDKMPTYDDLQLLHQTAFRNDAGAGPAYQCFVPPADHVNIHPRCLHLWGRVDGVGALPDFTQGTGSI